MACRPATPTPEHQHLGRAQRAGGRGQHREVAAGQAGRHERGLVAGDGGLRGERVHGLGAADAGQQLQGEARDLAVAQRAHGLEGLVRLQQADQHGALAQQPDLGRRGRIDLEHDVGGEGLGGGLDHRRRRVVLVADVAEPAGAPLDEHLRAQRLVLLGHGRHERHPGLAHRGLRGHAYANGHRSSSVRKGPRGGSYDCVPARGAAKTSRGQSKRGGARDQQRKARADEPLERPRAPAVRPAGGARRPTTEPTPTCVVSTAPARTTGTSPPDASPGGRRRSRRPPGRRCGRPWPGPARRRRTSGRA